MSDSSSSTDPDSVTELTKALMGAQLPAEAAGILEKISREALSKGTFLSAMRHLRDSLKVLTAQVAQLVDRIEAHEAEKK